jgi:hypothetical protein
MIKTRVVILGAGIAGLSAAAELKRKGMEDFLIIEKGPEVPRNFKNGVHYIHTDQIDFPFEFHLKEVQTIEQIWNPFTDEFKERANAADAIQYSLKVMGIRHNSSVLDPGRRAWKTFIPESNNMDDLIQVYLSYIGLAHFRFNSEMVELLPMEVVTDCLGVRVDILPEHIISTIPLPLLKKDIHFKSKRIWTANYPAKDIVANFFVGLYIPDKEFPAYRITVLDKVISIEFMEEPNDYELSLVKHYLGKHFDYEMKEVTINCFQTGRIWGLEPAQRREIAEEFEAKGIYLVGRYGCWDGKLTIDTTIKQAQEVVHKILSKEMGI